ncbi:MAG: hypothetical protein JXA11_14545 [Phycisphaerae bacterium]|nr:hypothetical protein [Phycisphaerae bacterium]
MSDVLKTSWNKTVFLAIHPGALGDCILLGRVLEMLEGEVTFVGHGAVANLLAGFGVVPKTLDYDRLPMQELFTDVPVEQTRLTELLGTCDHLISFFGEGNPILEQRLARVCRARRATFLPIRPPAEYPGHLTELWLAKLGLPLSRKDLCTSVWRPPDEWKQSARRLLQQVALSDEKYVVLHPGAGGAQKRRPIEEFLEVAWGIQTQLTCRPVFVLGPVERENFTKSDINLLAAYPVITKATLEEFSGVLAGAEAFVGNDSGPAHLAAAIGIKTLSLFRVTSEKHFAPLGKKAKNIGANSEPKLVLQEVLGIVLS